MDRILSNPLMNSSNQLLLVIERNQTGIFCRRNVNSLIIFVFLSE